jgi:hypothetical protein
MSRRRSRVNEFSRLVSVESIGPKVLVRKIEAGEEERRGLAERFGLAALGSLSATLELWRPAGDIVRARGHLVADAVQSCVVTLAPVPAHIEADFACSYAGGGRPEAEVDFDPLAEEEIEALVGEEIDIGETVAQQLAIALDPYPRAPGAAWPDHGRPETGGAGESRKKPFGSLEKLKKP